MKEQSLEDFLAQQLDKDIDEKTLIALLKTEKLNFHELAQRFNVPLLTVRGAIRKLTNKTVMVRADGESIYIAHLPEIGSKKKLNPDWWNGRKLRFGFASDAHLGSKYERLDVLHGLYDLFEKRDVPVVFNGGNFIDGEAKHNKNYIHKFGLDAQVEYAVEVYPYKPNIETWFISADEHEGWYTMREGIDMGRYWQMLRERNGMFDLKHIGFVEADIDVHGGTMENPVWLRLMHPGGGSAYAHSYAPQKIVESFQPGEKPHILLIGHFHKGSYDIIRGVHTLQILSQKDQCPWMRKHKIDSHVGGGMIEITVDERGMITEFEPRIWQYFDRKFYEGNDKFWKKIK